MVYEVMMRTGKTYSNRKVIILQAYFVKSTLFPAET